MPLPHKSSYAVPSLNLKGFKALVVTTSQATLDHIDSATGQVLKRGRATGVYASEMTEPYYVFLDAGMDVDVASIKGGKIPVETLSVTPLVRTDYDKRFLSDPVLRDKVENSLCIADLDFTKYDVVFMAGGWGAAYDLAQSEVLNRKITEAYAAGLWLGSVCHGALGFIGATKPDGTPLVQGVKVTGVTNRQIQQLGISITPKHPETELRNAGALFECNHALIEMTANHVVVDSAHKIVSAQNQKGGVEAAVKALEALINNKKTGAVEAA
ncbi:MAG TPA: type 1 glutamine amidotransferase domain-containing protein [Polyangium sp.]|nr:type 1 glutamine amidotransferase domain-containing protein [Polyangium sp.]